MRTQKILKTSAIIFFIVCVIFIAIDIFKVLKINIDFMGMQESKRISSSSKADAVRYEPTEYVITNKEDALEEIKKITVELKNEHIKSGNIEGLFEIANINKIEKFFYEYEKYVIVKYKLLNIIEDLPVLYKATKNNNTAELKSYFDKNLIYLENYYGITSSDDFITFVNSLKFLENNDIKIAVIQDATIYFDYNSDILTFNMKMISDNDNSNVYPIKVQYYESSSNQVAPYVEIRINE